MAECLVHQRVPFDVIRWIVVHGAPHAATVREVLTPVIHSRC